MTYCADYNPSECPITCYYAERSEELRKEPNQELKQYVTMSKIYGTQWCDLTRDKGTPVFIKNYIL